MWIRGVLSCQQINWINYTVRVSSRSHRVAPAGNHQKIVLRVVEALQLRGYDVWVDVQQMSGSTVDAMALAVENASVVLICISRSYKESSNCRLEANYALQREVGIVPLMLEEGYHPDGCTLAAALLRMSFCNVPLPYSSCRVLKCGNASADLGVDFHHRAMMRLFNTLCEISCIAPSF
eukprot:SAG11_NODE_252_length_11593_cov_7.436663_5_plen_179_part_00